MVTERFPSCDSRSALVDAGLEVEVPTEVQDAVGSIEWARKLPTKTKSNVLVLRRRTGLLLAKQGQTDSIARERTMCESILPALGVLAPRYRGWITSESAPWLLMDFVGGRSVSYASHDDRDAVSRWVARLHRAHAADVDIPRRLTTGIGPEERLEQVDASLRRQAESGLDVADELEACARVRHALPTTLAVADAMSPVLAHGDLIQQNVLSTARGIVAVDWERAGVASPATDLAIVEPATYCDEMHLLGLEADIDSIRRGAFAGRVLSALTHDIAAKRPKKQRRYLERMRAATEALIGTGGPA